MAHQQTTLNFLRSARRFGKRLKEDIREHDEKQIIEAIENSKSLKEARQKKRLGKGQLISSI